MLGELFYFQKLLDVLFDMAKITQYPKLQTTVQDYKIPTEREQRYIGLAECIKRVISVK